MVRVTQLCAKVVEESGLAGSRLLFRAPAVSTTPEDTLREVMPDLPPPGAHWSQNYATLRPYLPEMQEAVILAWLSLDQSRKNWEHPPAQGGSEQPPKWEPPARVLARGMERVMDLGALKGLMGTFVGNVLFVRHRYEKHSSCFASSFVWDTSASTYPYHKKCCRDQPRWVVLKCRSGLHREIPYRCIEIQK